MHATHVESLINIIYIVNTFLIAEMRQRFMRKYIFVFSLVFVQTVFLQNCIALKHAITPDRNVYAHPKDQGIVLPRDHAAHPRFKTEWWYWNGHLSAEDGQQFGFQLRKLRMDHNFHFSCDMFLPGCQWGEIG